MENNIIIDVELVQEMDNEKETSGFKYEGMLNEKDEKLYIRYVDNGEKNLIKVDKNEILVQKGNNKLIFNIEKEYETYYETPMGTLNLKVKTLDIKIEEEKIYIEYDLYNNKELVANNKFKLSYEEM